MAYKQQPKSPVLKALVGDQHKLPKVLKDAILASPAKQTARPADPPKMSDAARKEMVKKMSGTFAEAGASAASTLKPSKKAMKDAAKKMIKGAQPSSPAKQSTYKGGYYKTDAQMADRQRRVDGGLPVRRQDYAPGPEGQKAFKADRSASMHNRIAWKKDLRNKVISGEITAAEAGKARRDFGKDWQANASSKRTKADRDKNDAVSTYVWTGKGFKRKVSDAEKASYESVSGGKSPAKQTKKNRLSDRAASMTSHGKVGMEGKRTDPKPTPRLEKSPKKRKAQHDAAIDSVPSNPRKTSKSKSKNSGQKKTLDGNVIKYSKNSPAKVKDPVTGKKVKGYAKANDKVSKVRDRKERKETKAELKATAKADGKITRLERKGINKSTRDLKTSQKNKRVVEFQKQKTKDVVSKENQRLRNKAKKLNDAVNVGYSQPKAQKKYAKTAAKADKRIGKAKEVEKRAIKNSKM